MRVIVARNVNEAYAVGMNLLAAKGVEEETRFAPAIVMPYPVTTVYTRPWERVLFNVRRDCNPFFHLMEALWMLAGRNDAEWIGKYNSTFYQFSDDGVTFHGAYGYRWRFWFQQEPRGVPVTHQPLDQITALIVHLRNDPKSRRAVLQMWDPSEDLGAEGKDFPCNLSIAFRIQENVLDMTVFNRSNDIIWGAYGANAVHMSILQEYIASQLGVGIGTYYQVSNNYHAYSDVMEKMGVPDPHPMDPYDLDQVSTIPLVTEPNAWRMDLDKFMYDPWVGGLKNSFFCDVVQPMAMAWDQYKEKKYPDAIATCNRITASDWRRACREWLLRRQEKRDGKIRTVAED